jgi:SRSO17 transposase
LSVKALARALTGSAYQTVRWREGTNQILSCRFATVRVRHAGRARLWPQQWLLIEWPHDQAAPANGLTGVQRSFDPFIQQPEALLGHVHPQPSE